MRALTRTAQRLSGTYLRACSSASATATVDSTAARARKPRAEEQPVLPYDSYDFSGEDAAPLQDGGLASLTCVLVSAQRAGRARGSMGRDTPPPPSPPFPWAASLAEPCTHRSPPSSL